MARHVANKAALKVNPNSFEQVDAFKYLGKNSKNNTCNEIQLRISNANRACFATKKILSLYILSATDSKCTRVKIVLIARRRTETTNLREERFTENSQICLKSK